MGEYVQYLCIEDYSAIFMIFGFSCSNFLEQWGQILSLSLSLKFFDSAMDLRRMLELSENVWLSFFDSCPPKEGMMLLPFYKQEIDCHPSFFSHLKQTGQDSTKIYGLPPPPSTRFDWEVQIFFFKCEKWNCGRHSIEILKTVNRRLEEQTKMAGKFNVKFLIWGLFFRPNCMRNTNHVGTYNQQRLLVAYHSICTVSYTCTHPGDFSKSEIIFVVMRGCIWKNSSQSIIARLCYKLPTCQKLSPQGLHKSQVYWSLASSAD